MLFILLVLFIPARGQNPCTRGQPAQLATVAVWSRQNDSQTVFRISDEDLSDEGFERSPSDRENFPVQLSREPGSCPVGLCALRLSTSRRISDGAILHTEDVYALPEGYDALHDDFYCGRALGDCGADVPIYRYTQGRGPTATPGYSMDASATIPGFTRDPRPICYGWSDGTGSRRPVTGEGCQKYSSVPNGQITYSVRETATFAVGTTGNLHCSSGFLSSGPTAALCTRSGWNPPLFGDCIRQNATIIPNSVSVISSGSSRRGAPCTAAATVKNGQLVYSQVENSGRLPTGTTAATVCFLGFVSTSSAAPRCENGDWIGQWPICVAAEKVQCQPLTAPPNGGKILYEPSESPLTWNSTATLQCPTGTAAAGSVQATCNKDGWQPKTLGTCVTGLPCLPVAVLGGTATYIQANPAALYSAGTTANIVCNLGNVLTGAGSVVCTNGGWTPMPGSCAPSGIGGIGGIGTINSGSIGATCPDFLPPLGATISYSLPAAGLGTRPSATVATLTCPLGQTVSGSLSSTCSNGIWSPAVLGTCSANPIAGAGGNGILECANPLVLNGMVTYSQSTPTEPVKPVGTVATVACNLGYTPSGAVSATCQNGVWSPALGTCNMGLGAPLVGIGAAPAGECFFGVLPPLGATVTYSNGAALGPYPAGTVASLRCTSGAAPTGAASASCTAGAWTPGLLGSCPLGGGLGMLAVGGTTCPAPLPPAGGSFTYSQAQNVGAYNSGTTATLMCTTGSPTGTTTSTCTNGAWTPPLGTCSGVGGIGGVGEIGQTCPAMLPPFGTAVTYSQGGVMGPFNQGTTATLTCTDVSQQLTGVSTATCQVGQWTPSILGTSCTPRGSLSLRRKRQVNIGGIQCPAGPIQPAGATLTYSNGQIFGPYPAGTSVTMQCTGGGVVQGTPTSTCSNGIWTPTLGTCSTGGIGGQTCPAGPLTPTGATLSYSNGQLFGPYPAGTTATMQCTAGGITQGTPTSTCSNGIWSPPLGICSTGGIGGIGGPSCPAGPLTPAGGSLSYSNGQLLGPYPSGTTATLFCGAQQASGASTATCSNGIWSQLGTCGGGIGGIGGTSCGVGVLPPLGATITYSNGQPFGPYPSGTTATVRCTTGVPTGTPTATCSNGIWSPATLGSCSNSPTDGTSCAPLPSQPGFSTVTYSPAQFGSSIPTGTTATLTCSQGFVQGSTTASCSQGQWYPQIGYCNQGGGGSGQQCSFAPATPLGGSLSYSTGSTFGPWQAGTTVTVTCPFGQYPQGANTATCNNGAWSQLATSCSSSNTGGGTGQQCSFAPATPLGGSLSYSTGSTFGPWQAGTTVTVTCPFGQYPQGSSTATCNNGAWSQLATSCSSSNTGGGTGQQCSFAPATPLGGSLSYSTGSTFGPWQAGTTVTVTCPFGQYPQGANTATCNNGAWSQLATSCSTSNTGGGTGQQCSFAPATPLGGSLSYSTGSTFGPWQAGTTVTVTCPFGQYPQGSTTATCNNGVWSQLATSCSSSNTGGGTGQQCSFAPAIPLGGSLSYSTGSTFGPWQAGTTVTVTCPLGQYPQGSSTATCSNGAWSQLATSCSTSQNTAFGCQPMAQLASRMSGGDARYSPALQATIPVGSSVSLVCDPGYYASGTQTATCTQYGWQPAILGYCTGSGIIGGGTGASGTPCYSGLTTFSGTVSYSNGQQFGPWNAGTTATLTCQAPNYLSSGSQTSICSNGQWSPSQLGTCTQTGLSGTGTSFSSCQAIPYISGGSVTYSNFGIPPYNEGTTATLVCQFGTVLSGQSNVVCRSGGWTPFPGLGSCPQALHSPARFKGLVVANSTDSPPSSESCPPPKAPPFGEITYSTPEEDGLFAPGTTAALRCVDNHGKKGASFATCRSGMFRPLLGSCESEEPSSLAGVCLPLQSPINGRISYIQASATTALEAGSTALLDCDDGHAISGRATLSCSADGSWTPEDGFGECELVNR